MDAGDSPAMIFFWASATAPFTASLLSFKSETSELSVVVVVFTSAVLLATAVALASASLALASAAAAALLASPICASRFASSSCSCLICCCWASIDCRNASTCSARMAVADFAGFLGGFLSLSLCAGCGSPSFGVSANAVPDIRNSDKIIAAVFLIASLFLYCNLMEMPVSLRTFAQVHVEGASLY